MNVDPSAVVPDELGSDRVLAVDVHGPPEPDGEVRGHRREAVPGRENPGRFVERRGDEAAVLDARPRLVVLREREPGLVLAYALLGRMGKLDAGGVVPAAPAGRVVMRRDSRLYRRPPRSKCALKKLADPAVAIEAEAEISSASVAAATIWAKR